MASVFELTESSSFDENRKIECFRWLYCPVVLISIIEEILGGIFTVQGIYVQTSVAFLRILPFANQLAHVVNTVIALGVLSAFAGVVGIACRSYEGLKLCFVITSILAILEIAIGSTLLSMRPEFAAVDMETLNTKCKCADHFSTISALVTSTISVMFTLAFIQVLVLGVICRLVRRSYLRQQLRHVNDENSDGPDDVHLRSIHRSGSNVDLNQELSINAMSTSVSTDSTDPTFSTPIEVPSTLTTSRKSSLSLVTISAIPGSTKRHYFTPQDSGKKKPSFLLRSLRKANFLHRSADGAKRGKYSFPVFITSPTAPSPPPPTPASPMMLVLSKPASPNSLTLGLKLITDKENLK